MTEPTRGNVFITGAAAGIGAATTRLLVRAGYTVFAGVHKDVGSLPGTDGVHVVPIDVTDPASVANAAEQVQHIVGTRGLHAIINNAGIIVQGPLELIPPEDLRRQFEVNTFGPVYVIQAFLPMLRAGHGRVVNVSAPSARVPIPFAAPISASKAALASLSDALRVELAAWRIPVVVIIPGGTETAIFVKADEAAQAALVSTDPRRAALYRNHLAAVAKAIAKQKLGAIDPVATTVVTAVGARAPKRRYATGSGVRVFAVLAHLPIALRERLLATVFGLAKMTTDPMGSQ